MEWQTRGRHESDQPSTPRGSDDGHEQMAQESDLHYAKMCTPFCSVVFKERVSMFALFCIVLVWPCVRATGVLKIAHRTECQPLVDTQHG